MPDIPAKEDAAPVNLARPIPTHEESQNTPWEELHKETHVPLGGQPNWSGRSAPPTHEDQSLAQKQLLSKAIAALRKIITDAPPGSHGLVSIDFAASRLEHELKQLG